MLRASRGRERPFIFISRRLNRRRGFTLVEILVVLAIIIVVASLTIPLSLRARVQANEAAAVGNLRTISSSAETFRSGTNPPSYPADFAAMVNANPPYLDSSWNISNQRQGYTYGFTGAANGETYFSTATPRIPNVSGVNSYCVDHTGIIRRYTRAGALGSAAAGCNTNGTPL